MARWLTHEDYALTSEARSARDFGSKGQVQDLCDHAWRPRSATRGSIKYLIAYEQGQGKKGNPER
jgi:hypothetical protein